MAAIPVETIPLKTIDLSPGSHLLLSDVTWEQYEALLKELGGDRHIPRINYCNGTLELMAPLPAHERPHHIIAYIVTNILDAQDRAWEDFGSTTFKKPKRAGLEPDTCFYIQNIERVRSLMRMDILIPLQIWRSKAMSPPKPRLMPIAPCKYQRFGSTTMAGLRFSFYKRASIRNRSTV